MYFPAQLGSSGIDPDFAGPSNAAFTGVAVRNVVQEVNSIRIAHAKTAGISIFLINYPCSREVDLQGTDPRRAYIHYCLFPQEIFRSVLKKCFNPDK